MYQTCFRQRLGGSSAIAARPRGAPLQHLTQRRKPEHAQQLGSTVEWMAAHGQRRGSPLDSSPTPPATGQVRPEAPRGALTSGWLWSSPRYSRQAPQGAGESHRRRRRRRNTPEGFLQSPAPMVTATECSSQPQQHYNDLPHRRPHHADLHRYALGAARFFGQAERDRPDDLRQP